MGQDSNAISRTVLSVAYPLTEVGPDAVGGSEQVLTQLDRALTKAGHRSIVIAAEGSKVTGTLIPAAKAKGKLNDKVRRAGQQVHRQLIGEALSKYPIDLVHMHSLDFHQYIPGTDVPVLATLHLPPDWYPDSIFKLKRRHFYINCVSTTQQRRCPPCSLMLPPVPNGIDINAFHSNGLNGQRRYVLAMGRICPEKGFHLALEAARQAQRQCILAGQVFPYEAHQKYYEKEIVPRLDSRRRFIGPAKLGTKKKLLSNARCLLIPSTVAETSSLVAMESLASGTPVVAFRSGALPEVIEHGRTGFLVSDVKEMADAIDAVGELSPEECRDAARTRFSAQMMADRYLESYERIIEKAEEQDWERVRPGTSWLFAW